MWSSSREKEDEAMSRTEEFLKEAFAGESQTNRKYLAFAAKADQEGFPQVARLFRAAARSETIHAHTILRALGWVRTTKENLQEAITSETNAFKNRYPAMIEAAKSEGNKEAEKAFTYANEAEKVHAKLYQKILDSLGSSQENYPYYICSICSFTEERKSPEICPVCGAKGEMFQRIE
jgi:rubrerythrin